jgi:ADP-ribosylation factor GTPase-activating protein 1
MDAWTPQQVEKMKAGGNDRCNEFLQQHGVSSTAGIREKYDSPAAELYKDALKARIEGRPEPTELPTKIVPKKAPQKKKMEGFGSSPPTPSLGRSSLTVILSVVSLFVAAASWLFSR